MRIVRLMILCLLAACGGHNRVPAPGPSPELLLQRARSELRRGAFSRAEQSFRRLLFELTPNDPALPEVHYQVAEAQFQTGRLLEAAQGFRQTADSFAGSAYASLALLRAGDANLRLWRKPELDPSYGQAALAIYQDLAGRYPASDAAARAQLHVRQLREWFADKTYKNGLFYFRRGAFDSGIIYFKDVVATYPEAPRAADALLRMADSYRVIGYRDELQETCAHLRRYYPQANGIERSCPPDSAVH
jgi:outer membrane protein assembly factor BamD